MLRIGLFLMLLVVIGCSQHKQAILEVEMQNSSNKKVIYQMMTRLFGNKKVVNKTYGTLEENGVGKLSDITEKSLAALRDLGVTHVWYTGVLEHALLTDYTSHGIPLDGADVVKGRAGSPYAIKDYYDVNPDLATNVSERMLEFDQLVDRTHNVGLAVIIDFVPNHVARSYASDSKPEGIADLGDGDDTSVRFAAENNFYYLPGEIFQAPSAYVTLGKDNASPAKNGKFKESPAKVTGNDHFAASPEVDDWFETIKLNYGVDIENGGKTHFNPIPNTWNKMKNILMYWAGKKIDGFRCDMAEMVPVEFWNWVIPQVRAVNPEIIFIAEIYNPKAYRSYIEVGGFDYLYDKVQLYDTLRLLVNGKSSTTDIPAIQESLSGINGNMLHFLENHDEQRIASPYFAGDPFKALPAMVISATIDQGPIMVYFGQEVGEPGKGNEGFQGEDGRTTIYDYWGIPEHQKWMNGGAFDGGALNESQKELRRFYSVLLNLAKTNSAITSGNYYDLTADNISLGNFSKDVYACVRSNKDERLLIVAGFNAIAKSIKIEVPTKILEQIQLSQSKNYEMVDLLTGQTAELSQNKFQIELPAYGSFIFRIQ